MAASTSGATCHHTAAFAIRAFANALEAESRNGTVPVEVIRRLADALAAAPGPLAPRFASAEDSCSSKFAFRQFAQVRRNYVGRIIARAMTELLDAEPYGIRRGQLPQLFAALRLIVGDEAYEATQRRCGEILGQLPGDCTERWDHFYAHPEIRLIAERLHVSLARAFRRFDTRKDWFITIMNNAAAAQSVGSSVFVMKKRDDAVQYFGEKHLARMLSALLGGYRTLSVEQEREFQSRWGEPSGRIFGPVYVAIAKIGD